MQPVEVADEVAWAAFPRGAEVADELFGAPVAFVVLQPGFAEREELVFQPAADHVDRDPAVGEVVGGGDPLGEDTRVPQAGVDCCDDAQPLGGQGEGETEARGFVLVVGPVAGDVPHLGERVVETVVLGEDREFAVVVVAPVGALLDGAGDEAAADVGDPVGELQRCGLGRLVGHGGVPFRLVLVEGGRRNKSLFPT